MKLFLPLTLIWFLCSTAGALQCQICTNTQCSSTTSITCPTETMCVTASLQASSSGISLQQIVKACAPSALCPATGTQALSANFGVLSALASVQCCDTDNCNSGTPSSPAAQSPNSLQCFTCNPVNSQCDTPLQCMGVEDRCVQASVTSGSSTAPYFGCASANLCAAAASLFALPPLQSIGNISEPTCCETSLCNRVATTPAAAPTTVTTAATTSEACRIRHQATIHLLLGLLIFTLC